MDGIHVSQVEVGPEAIDANGHASNVEFVRWMQDAAVQHSDATGCTAATREVGAMWMVRSHRIDYRRPAMRAGRTKAPGAVGTAVER